MTLRKLDGWLSPQEYTGHCDVCGLSAEHCICEKCPVCGETGNLDCVRNGHLPHPMKRLFPDYTGPRQLCCSVYKHTDCGPWITFVTGDYILDPVTGKDTIREVRGDDAPDSWEELGPIHSIKVGSIVEDADVRVGPLSVPLQPVETLVERFWISIVEVNIEAGLRCLK